MNETIKSLLDEEIEAEIRGISTLDLGSEQRAAAIDDLAALYRLRIEEMKSESELSEKSLKRDQLAEQVKDRYFRLGIAAAEIAPRYDYSRLLL